MPNWKKLIVSGSDASLNNLSVNNAVTASFFKGDGSALTGISASIAETATSVDTFTGQTSYTATHNFNTKNVIVSVYDSNDEQIIPASISTPNDNNVTVTFDEATSGRVIVAKGGHLISGISAGSNTLNGLSGSYYLSHSNFTGAVTGSGGLFSGHLLPTESSSYDLGSVSKPWRDLYLSSASLKLVDENGVVVKTLNSSNIVTTVEIDAGNIVLTGSLPANIVSSSAQIATDISGSFTSLSSSLQQRITDNKTNIDSLTAATSSYLLNTTDTLTGDLTVTGKITAQEFHTEFVSSSIIYQSGSTKFGDTQDDNHDFTGSVNVNGSVTATSFTGIFEGALSSSAQIAADISGSFNSPSASFSSRVSLLEGTGSNHESRLDTLEGKTLVSSSAQIAADISGSFTELSSSLEGRVSNLEDFSSSLDATYATDAQVATAVSSLNAATSSYALKANISGSFTSLSSSLELRLTTASQRIDNADQLITNLTNDKANKTAVSGSFTFLSSSIASRFDTNESRLDTIQAATSSYALAANISGAFSPASSSFSTRVSTLESTDTLYDGRLDSIEAATSSYALAANISGSFVAASSSFSTRVSTLEATDTLYDGRLDSIESATSSYALAANISGAFSPASSSFSTRVSTLESTDILYDGRLDSIESATSSYALAANISGAFSPASSSFSTRVSTLEATDTLYDGRLDSIESATSSYALAANISGSFTSLSSSITTRQTADEINIAALQSFSSSVDTALNFSGNNLTVAGDLTVNGTASINYLQSVTGEAKIIGDNYILLNADTPSQRYSGIRVLDSGSAGETGSLEYDSISNHWFYESNNEGYASILMAGPKGTRGSLGVPTSGSLVVAAGNHLYSSNITDLNSKVSIDANTVITGSLTTSGNTSSPKFLLPDGGDIAWNGGYSSGNPTLSANGDEFRLYAAGNGSSNILYLSDTRLGYEGDVGIGTTSPSVKLHVAHDTSEYSTSLTDTTTKATLHLKTHGGDSTITSFGGISGGGGYIQRSNGTGTTSYDILLNPYGGDVGIGTTSPATKLHVAGAISGSSLNVSDAATTRTNLGLGTAATSAATDFVAVTGDTMTGALDFNKTNSASGGDYDFVTIGYNGSWSGNVDGMAAISVNDGGGIVGRFGISYNTTDEGYFAVKNLYNGGSYGASGTVFKVDSDGDGTFSGGLTVAGTIAANGGINGLTLANGGISGTNFNITGVNQLEIADPGEGIVFKTGASGDMTLAIVDDSSDNILRFSGTGAQLQVNTNRVLTVADEGSGNGLDADTVDGVHASYTRNSANTIPVRDANGYLNLGWINTTSGNTTNASTDYYVNTNDGYIRKKTLANVRTEIMGVSSGDSFLRSDTNDTFSGVLTMNRTSGQPSIKSGNDHIVIDSYDATTNVYLQNYHAGDVVIATGGGSVGVGTDSPLGGRFHVYNSNGVFEGPSTGQTEINSSVQGILVGPTRNRSVTANSYYPGIAFNHLLNYNSGTGYNSASHGWIGLRLYDTPGSEQSNLVFATKPGTGSTNTGNDVPIERMCIDPFGNVGIGTKTPSSLFEVVGTTGQLFSIDDSQTGEIFAVSDISGVPLLSANSAGYVKVTGDLRVTGDITSYFSSDIRLKKNIKPIESPLEKLKLISGNTFEWDEENTAHSNKGKDIGVIAQEIEKVLPEIVKEKRGHKAVQYEKIVALLIESNKALLERVEQLESKLK